MHFIVLGSNILFNTPALHTVYLFSSLNTRDQVSHHYKTTGKITVLYNSISTFLERIWENKIF